ncbi:MAG: hypothetical protein CVV64_03970 [Candidatus Wallbacteria bacterium HGW-Wallbacteria-1]|jgi:putative hydrolase of HD superfamily|uniref:5'-deoxynucleotidase n=1 Tax=Candidatus Wallbacteria bacterium HGW-Wallbacteria-1 TaxID=2013854 RepID=A0A2N1PRF9_9BACT|nr:MAG: hypothetical protein CVV64_03970 [Candidatus Wallbacteria bacterium HGW-Wallbacteria-1]
MNMPVESAGENNLEKIIDFYSSSIVLKKMARTGWVVRGVDSPEHVADHSHGLALLVMLAGDLINHNEKCEIVSVQRAVMMAVIHEIGEIGIGDWTPSMSRFIGVEKDVLEFRVISELTEGLGESRNRFISLFDEFTRCESSEARLVKACDKLEMYLQALDYLKSGKRNLDDFIRFIDPESELYSWNDTLTRLAWEIKSRLNFFLGK